MTGTPPMSTEAENIVIAAVDLIGRTGARGFEIGYLHDGVPSEAAGWWAHAQFRGTRIVAENHRGPAEAAEALARTALTGGKCRCGRLVALEAGRAFAFFSTTLVTGTSWTAEQAAAAGQCLWTRVGRRWDPSCPVPAGRGKR
jgi:hypothetical protein